MKYIITGKNIFDGTSTNDKADPLECTEMCTEMIITRLQAIKLLNTGKICGNDTIVTWKDRFCLYENIFDNIIDYQDFLKLNVSSNDVIDLVSQIYNLCTTIGYKPVYNRLEEDRKEIFDINLSSYRNFRTDPFVCLLIRKRGAWSEKNLDDDYWISLIERLLLSKINIVVFGKDTEKFKELFPNIVHLNSFKDWCSFIANDRCQAVISTTSGGVYPIFFVGNGVTKLIIIDNNKLVAKHGDDPSFYNDCINFTGTKIKVFDYVPTNEEIVNNIHSN